MARRLLTARDTRVVGNPRRHASAQWSLHEEVSHSPSLRWCKKSPPTRLLPLFDLLVDTVVELFALAARSGLQVLDAVLEDDRTTICVARYAHQTGRAASRAWPGASEVILGGRKVVIRRPRVRSVSTIAPAAHRHA